MPLTFAFVYEALALRCQAFTLCHPALTLVQPELAFMKLRSQAHSIFFCPGFCGGIEQYIVCCILKAYVRIDIGGPT